ncbi:type II toxin-antitoxin system RelE/ParE family toxin [candidate division KSB1 bacterium]|nr:type II toxin-antitoxin system RelE/ParE family toxin [candidate division KSB1 bacterium]
MKPVQFHAEARAELFESIRYYESQQSGLGKRLMAALRDAVQRIQANPLLYHILEDDIRQCRVLRFPYGLIYRCKEERIEIIAVMHLRRKPGYWKTRIKANH